MSLGSTMTFNQSDMRGTFAVAGGSTIAYAKGETTVDTFYDSSNSETIELENFDSEPE